MRRHYVSVLAGLTIWSAGCGVQTENSQSLDAIKYAAGDVREILNDKCLRCHEWIAYDDATLILKKYVKAGDPANSPIYYRMQGSIGDPSDAAVLAKFPNTNKNMPDSGSINPGDVRVIYNWIMSL